MSVIGEKQADIDGKITSVTVRKGWSEVNVEAGEIFLDSTGIARLRNCNRSRIIHPFDGCLSRCTTNRFGDCSEAVAAYFLSASEG